MISHQLWWAWWFKTEYIVQIRFLTDNVEKRFLPTFDTATAEAEKIEQDAWQRFKESASPNADPGDGAERAFQKGLAHYMALDDFKQGFVNFSAAYCYHLFEQQLFYFHRTELLTQKEKNDQGFYRHEEVRERLEQHGIAIQGFRSWLKLDELRLVANVVKHAEGPSADELKRRRAVMFIKPVWRGDKIFAPLSSPPLPVSQPLFGQDFYVTIDDLREYATAVIEFWTELAGILETQDLES